MTFYNKIRRLLKHCVCMRYYLYESIYFLRFGKDFPRRYELIWCEPSEIKLASCFKGVLIPEAYRLDKNHAEWDDSFISGKSWDMFTIDIDEYSTIARIKEKLSYRKSWYQSGEYDFMYERINRQGHSDGCRTTQDIDERCARLDLLIDYISHGGELLAQKQLSGLAFREKGGIGVALSRNGDFIFMGDGAHRLAIARYFNVRKIPTSIVKVHCHAIKNGSLAEIRKRSNLLNAE